MYTVNSGYCNGLKSGEIHCHIKCILISRDAQCTPSRENTGFHKSLVISRELLYRELLYSELTVYNWHIHILAYTMTSFSRNERHRIHAHYGEGRQVCVYDIYTYSPHTMTPFPGMKGTAYTLMTEKEDRFACELVRNLEQANQNVPDALLALANKVWVDPDQFFPFLAGLSRLLLNYQRYILLKSPSGY